MRLTADICHRYSNGRIGSRDYDPTARARRCVEASRSRRLGISTRLAVTHLVLRSDGVEELVGAGGDGKGIVRIDGGAAPGGSSSDR